MGWAGGRLAPPVGGPALRGCLSWANGPGHQGMGPNLGGWSCVWWGLGCKNGNWGFYMLLQALCGVEVPGDTPWPLWEDRLRGPRPGLGNGMVAGPCVSSKAGYIPTCPFLGFLLGLRPRDHP